jgi:hypothetical protein
VTPQQLRRLRSLIPADGVYIDANRAKRLYDATPNILPDEARVQIVKGVMAMLAEARV